MEKEEFLKVLDETGADAARFRYILAHPLSATALIDDVYNEARSTKSFDETLREAIDARIAKKHRAAATREG